MAEFIIGRGGSSVLEVPADRVSVSGEHVKIIIDDTTGRWMLQDLGSANGTYVRGEDGEYKRVDKKVIDENTFIRLGPEGHSSFAFMAHKAKNPVKHYEYEFHHLKKLLKTYQEEERKLEARNTRNMQIVKAAAPIVMVICVLIQYIIPALRQDANLNLWISRGAMALAPWIIGIFFGVDKIGANALKKKKQNTLRCPQCGAPVSEFDIHNMKCSRCKAK